MRVSDYGPEERALFESEATALYEDIVAHGGIKKVDPRIAPKSGSARAAFDMLLDLDLVILDAPTATYVAVDHSTIQSRIVAPLGIPERGFDGDHYDVPVERRDELVAAGAVAVTSRELVARLNAAGLRRRRPRSAKRR